MSLITAIPIITDIVGGVKGYFERRSAIKERKQEQEFQIEEAMTQAKIERIKTGKIIQADYDLEALKQARDSWIDEILILWVMVLVTLLFIPGTQTYAIAGFTALAQLPEWFQVILVGIFIAKLGLRFLFGGRRLFGKNVPK